MDRPMGPRQPDKRHAAYESIFGRPSVNHQTAPIQPPQPLGQQYPQYSSPLDRRTSQASSQTSSSRAPSLQYHTNQQPVYRQHYPSTSLTQVQQGYPPYYTPGYTQSLAPPSVTNRARSINSSSGIISPLPPQREEPTNASLDSLTRAGLTPAQAYQAQVYMNSPMAQQSPLIINSPSLPVTIESDDGNLGLDFMGGTNTPSEHSIAQGEFSELPWTSQSQQHVQHTSARSRMSIISTYEQAVAGPSFRPPSLDSTAFPNMPTSSTASPVSSSSTKVELPSTYVNSSGRRSSESMPPGTSVATYRRERTSQDRARSMSAAVNSQTRAMAESIRNIPRSIPAPLPPLPSGHDSPRPAAVSRRIPIVYPALLSRVAEAFKARIQLGDRFKDGLTYKDAFDGREAVDQIAYIIKTTDRNLALLLGRALDAQKFFHAVTYDHRLRDSPNDIYQFRTKLPSPFVSGDLANIEEDGGDTTPGRPPLNGGAVANRLSKSSPSLSTESDGDKTLAKDSSRPTSPSPPDSVVSPSTTRPRQGSISSDDVPLPSGVFTLLTDCYSPTCSRDQLCYSIACPRRLEQQARLHMKPQPGLKKQISRESLGELVEPGTLWIHTVPQEIVNSVSDQEKKRQEAINEVCYTERDFVRDMEYLRDSWVKPLRESDIIPEARRTEFVQQVFWNVNDIIAVNIRLRDALNKRQKSYAVVEQIGDILRDAVPHFGPFVSYGAHQLYGKYEFEKEKNSNPAFARFVEEVERRPESRKLELNGYLTKPTTRLARYPLLLEAVLKHTPDDNPDKTTLPEAIKIVREFLKAVNTETGKAENRFNLLQLDQQLVFRSDETPVPDLRLKEEGRELVYKGALKKRGGGQSDSSELQVFLFDHALLMVKPKNKADQYKVYRTPIPLELLIVSAPDEFPSQKSQGVKQKQLLTKNAPHALVVPVKDAKGGFPITFVHLGRKYYQITLWASTYVSQRKWVENIVKQQDMMKERSSVFATVTLNEGFFVGPNRVNCAAPYDNGRRAVYGTDDGVYLSNLWEPAREPVKVLALNDVAQVDVLEDYQLLIVMSERQVITFPLDSLDPMDPMSGLKRAKRIASHISFFKTGICLGKTLVCVVKASPLSSTVRAFEPIDQNQRGRSKPTFRKLLQGGNDTLRVFKEFYIPLESSSVHFLKTKLCVGCTTGFVIVDLETLDTQALLDPADKSLDFVRDREKVREREKERDNLRPLAIYRIDNEFLLCYDEFAFYVNKAGWRSRADFKVYWEGFPTGFALHYPYVLAFEPTFVEVRHVETGGLSQIIQGNNLRCLFADTPPSTTNTANRNYNPYTNYGQNPYAAQTPPMNQYGMPGQNGYGIPIPAPYGNPYYPRAPTTGRDEILMSSDDRIMRLYMSAPTS